MRIALITDAWAPQVNGVVTTLTRTCRTAEAMGHELRVISPSLFRTVPCPTYPSIRLALRPGPRLALELSDFDPQAVHLPTEGPLGLAGRAWCLKHDFPFTTAWHTRFPEYVQLRTRLPVGVSYAWLRRFHRPAVRTLVSTETQRHELREHGFGELVIWGRGVDTAQFQPYGKNIYDLPRPISLYAGRVAVEKNLEAFLRLELPGSKVVIGDGPDLPGLRKRYPQVTFTGFRSGEDLARHIAGGDVFVFPSRTDTYGLVMLEAMACGLPVAAFPVPGPQDVVRPGRTGVLDDDLARAVHAALALDPQDCIQQAREHSWEAATRIFLGHLAPVDGSPADQPGAAALPDLPRAVGDGRER